MPVFSCLQNYCNLFLVTCQAKILKNLFFFLKSLINMVKFNYKT
nr:MAG TPA: hypothetical protein [Caudoviricetes sp.]